MNRLQKISIIYVIFSVFILPYTAHCAEDEDQFVVVLDAGHGGKDSGARGSFSMEKDVVLDITKQVGHYIQNHLPEIRVLYTREDDSFVKLFKRAEIANRNEADLFVSIHANASPSNRAFGTETFVMGLHKTESNLEVAQKENAVITLEENYEEHYEGYDPHSAESYIIFSLMQNAFLEQSLRAAELTQKEFRERARRKDRGVKQAGFLVLWKTTMPSILIETGCISNSNEEAYLNSDQGKDYLASAIFRAIRSYYEEMKAQKAEEKPQSEKQIAQTETQNKSNDVYFMVQLTASSQMADTAKAPFSNLDNPLEIQKIGKYYKYFYGKVNNYKEAKKLQKHCEAHFPDAFIVAFEGDNPISVQKAIKSVQ